jgi:hypothetical protein
MILFCVHQIEINVLLLNKYSVGIGKQTSSIFSLGPYVISVRLAWVEFVWVVLVPLSSLVFERLLPQQLTCAKNASSKNLE